MKKALLKVFVLSISFSVKAYTVDSLVNELGRVENGLDKLAFISTYCSDLYAYPKGTESRDIKVFFNGSVEYYLRMAAQSNDLEVRNKLTHALMMGYKVSGAEDFEFGKFNDQCKTIYENKTPL